MLARWRSIIPSDQVAPAAAFAYPRYNPGSALPWFLLFSTGLKVNSPRRMTKQGVNEAFGSVLGMDIPAPNQTSFPVLSSLHAGCLLPDPSPLHIYSLSPILSIRHFPYERRELYGDGVGRRGSPSRSPIGWTLTRTFRSRKRQKASGAAPIYAGI